MSIIPELTIGLQTAWWLSVIYVMGMVLLMIIFPKESWIRFYGGSDSDFTKNKGVKRKIMNVGSWLCWFGLVFYAAFVPIKFGTVYFYSGLLIFTIGMILYEIAMINYASTTVGEPVTKGLYKISRNPIYLFDYVLWVGIGVLTASWIILLVKTIELILQHYLIIEEEHFCLEKYGESYKNYMQKIPRYLKIIN